MILRVTTSIFLIASLGCTKPLPNFRQHPLEARAAFKTKIFDKPATRTPAPDPPYGVFEKVRYKAPLGENAAYITPVKEGTKRPAMVWIGGGFDWSIDEGSWQPRPRENDQSARAWREAGMVLMVPSLRGCNDSPGNREYFLGEAADVVAAIDFVATRPDVDTSRIYLGGHSTGATLALLAAPSSKKLRGVFAFGPVASPRSYIPTGTALDGAKDLEMSLRAPINFLLVIKAKTIIIEGGFGGNILEFPFFKENKGTSPISFVEVPRATHFSVLAPVSELLAKKVMAAAGKTYEIELYDDEATRAFNATP